MARLVALPEQQIIDGFKGTVDFYLWKDIPCARKWPVWRPRTPTAAEKANQDTFKAIIQAWDSVDATTRQAFTDLAKGTGLTNRDVYIRAAMVGIYQHQGMR